MVPKLFHHDLFWDLAERFGYINTYALLGEEAAERIQDLYLAGKKDEAMLAVPTELADEISLVGSVDRIKDRLNAWKETPVSSLLVSTRSIGELRTFAKLVLG